MIPSHGGQLRAIAEQYGIPSSAILDFSANINPDGPPPSVLKALRSALEEPLTLTSYPDLELHSFKQSIALQLATTANSISVANGFVPLLEAAIRIRGIRRCLLPVPAFTEYRLTLERCGIEVIPYPLQSCGFDYDATLICAAIEDANADAILLANPQNPSGRLAAPGELTRLIQSTSASVLLDEAFIDYVPEASLTAEAATHPSLIVFRSLTKFFALPGLRVAYCVAHPDTAARINKILPPWPVTTLATIAVQTAFQDTAYQERARRQNTVRRDAFLLPLLQQGIAPPRSDANFLLLPLQQDAQTVWLRLLQEHHILLRGCLNFESLSGQFLRIAVRTEAENARLLSALTQVLHPV